MLEVPTKVNLANYQNLCALDSKYPSLSDYDNPIIKSIGRLPIKLFGSNKFIDIVKELNQFITSGFEINSKKITTEGRELTAKKERAKFDSYVKECVGQFTTYVLIDKVSNFDYYFGGDNEKLKNAKTRTRLVCVIVCEKLVTISPTHQSSCLIHLCALNPGFKEEVILNE